MLSELKLKYDQLTTIDELIDPKVSQPEFEAAARLIRRWLDGDQLFSFNTSGSTGSPKQIIHQRWKMELSAQRTIDTLGLSENMTALVCMSPQFIGGAMMIIRAHNEKMDLVIVPASRQPLEGLTSTFDITAMVPMQMAALLRSGSSDALQMLQNAQHVLLGGAGVTDELSAQLQTIHPRCWSTYGMTETVSHIALRQLNGPDASPFFTTMAGTKIKSGNQGQLLIRDKITDDQWLSTNDLVDIINDEQFRWLGRLDNVINSGGIKIMAEKVESDIEAAMKQLAPGLRYFIAGLPDAIYGSRVTLFLESSSTHDEPALLTGIRQLSALPKYELPKRLVILNSFPETASGKIDKQSILKRLI